MIKNTWQAVPGHPEIQVGQYIVPNFVSNSIAIQCNENEYILISPGEPLIENWKQLFPPQAKLHIVFPNAYHHLGVKAWLKLFPDTQLYASKLAISQLHKKGFENTSILALEVNPPPLPNDFYLRFPPGHRAGDVWVGKHSKESGDLWITCDSVLNYARVSNQPIARFLQKCLGAAPGLKISQVVKWFILNDRQAFKHWALQQLAQDKPTTLIPSHGEVKTDKSLLSQLENLLKSRL
ncbi:MAG: hypothetical protein HWE18_09095 [Gammaproteobacteria bacterium]|nr:hypothetical protein [Gammaproteobacteria bacterium]